MSALRLSALRPTPDEVAEVVALYASNPEYLRAAGEYDPSDIPVARVEADLRAEVGTEGCAVLLARDAEDRAVGLLSLLHRHPGDGYPWIGLLMVHGELRRRGVGRQLVALVEERFRDQGGDGVRLAVLENNPTAWTFWNSLGWREVDRRLDIQHGRPCVVMHKELV
ncbi:DNA mismatch repair protein MutT [Wenjunlia vitaminophila]|uniref:DNA mismatch repair protein MutT n=1 Tax=Wenjunlia vitaminophila TaxID=76728 RepID=A0A0T6LV81_WENVI|nr:GNAT family N-acetyltransferase [Wenjunlia vitaminophila]KRV49973.1 DNA mismatch repair protein MutT [Wenjunlia vitaminophila]